MRRPSRLPLRAVRQRMRLTRTKAGRRPVRRRQRPMTLRRRRGPARRPVRRRLRPRSSKAEATPTSKLPVRPASRPSSRRTRPRTKTLRTRLLRSRRRRRGVMRLPRRAARPPRSSFQRWARASPKGLSLSGSSRSVTTSRWTSLCSRSPPTRSTPRYRLLSPASSKRFWSRQMRRSRWAPYSHG